MRPVNADKLKEELQYYIECAGWGNGVNAGLKTAIEVIDNTVTIDVTPTVHAQWIEHDTMAGYASVVYKCSECGRTVRERFGINPAESFPYCHCGAKMGGDPQC